MPARRLSCRMKRPPVVWGMPGFVARGGLADAVLPISMIGPAHLCARVMARRRAQQSIVYVRGGAAMSLAAVGVRLSADAGEEPHRHCARRGQRVPGRDAVWPPC